MSCLRLYHFIEELTPHFEVQLLVSRDSGNWPARFFTGSHLADALDTRAEPDQFLLDTFVTTIDVVDAVHVGLALRH